MLVRFKALKSKGIVDNRVTLDRWMNDFGFPQPIQLGPNTLAWDLDEVTPWIAARKRQPKDAGGAEELERQKSLVRERIAEQGKQSPGGAS